MIKQIIYIVLFVLILVGSTGFAEVIAFEDFESGDFNGGTGWLEEAWSRSDTGILCLEDNEPLGFYHVRLQKTDETLIRSVNLVGKENVYLRFAWKGDFREDDSNRTYIEVNDNLGSGWVEVFSFSNTDYLYYSQDINLSTISTVKLSANFSLRLRMSIANERGYAYFDNIKFETPGTSLAPLPAATQTPGSTSTPTPVPDSIFTSGSSPGLTPALFLEAENYTAAYDTTSGNEGGVYRSDDVDIEDCHNVSSSASYNVSRTAAGEWLEWQADFSVSDYYTILLRIARATQDPGSIHLEMAGQDVSGPVSVPATGGWQQWDDVIIEDVYIPAGSFPVRFVLESDGVNLDYIYFSSHAGSSTGK